MDKSTVVRYIQETGRVEMPDVQQHFGLKYSEVSKVFSELEKSGMLGYYGGFAYEFKSRDIGIQLGADCRPQDRQEDFNIRALWLCVKSGYASATFIQRRLSVGYVMAARALDWMEENGYVSPAGDTRLREVLISREEFIAKFGDPDIDDDDSSIEDLDSFMERRRRELMERMRLMSAENDDDEEDDDEEDDDDDEDDDDEDIDKTAQERREYLEKRRRELIERMQREMSEDEEPDKEDHDKTVEALHTEIQRMPDYNADDDTFSIKMKIKYPDGMPFRVKAIERDCCFYLSDLGNTLKYLSSYNDRDALAKYFADTLKTENMCFIEEAVCTLIDDIHDLSGEAAFLFKVVNGLITQEHFDMYYLGEDCIKLANDILREDDAAMLVNAISVLDEKRVRVAVLQKQLNIGRPRANRIINTLAKLGVFSSAGVKSDKISNGFIAYLKRMLKNKSGG